LETTSKCLTEIELKIFENVFEIEFIPFGAGNRVVYSVTKEVLTKMKKKRA
jgi:hypothetical protein